MAAATVVGAVVRLLLVLLVSSPAPSSAAVESHRLYLSRVARVESLRARAAQNARLAGTPVPPDRFFAQPLDHFSAAEAAWSSPTFLRQRWWGNLQFWNGTGPVFVYVEGETAGSPYDVLEGEHVDFAREYGALVLALEHRGYGASLPDPSSSSSPVMDLSTRNLRFLSSHQAVADLARFLVEEAMPAYNFTPAARIVTFGGSYPGVVAAHARLRLPHLVHMALASSATVQSQLDYYEYNDVVGLALADPAVGGSAACAATVSAAFEAVAAAFAGTPAQRIAMAGRLRNCGTLGGLNDTAFAVSEYSNIFKEIVQGNGQWWMPESVAQVCGNMTAVAGAVESDNNLDAAAADDDADDDDDGGGGGGDGDHTGDADPVSALAAYVSAYVDRHYGKGACFSSSYAAEVAYASNTSTAAWAGRDQYRCEY
jgi:pimeloyl-ACP methyl ester carboxylesterase